jgi:hypothetical protein
MNLLPFSNEEFLQAVSYVDEESLASFPPLCKNTDMPYEECDCEECRQVQGHKMKYSRPAVTLAAIIIWGAFVWFLLGLGQ